MIRCMSISDLSDAPLLAIIKEAFHHHSGNYAVQRDCLINIIYYAVVRAQSGMKIYKPECEEIRVWFCEVGRDDTCY